MTNIASGNCYEPYLIAAGQNLQALVDLAKQLGDTEFAEAAGSLLDAFHDYAGDCQHLIDQENAPLEGVDEDQFWRLSDHAIRAGMGEVL